MLERDGIDHTKYIKFYGLRNHDMFDQPRTEIIYIHSKLMIVDDKYVIIGSANINDRSMNGDRDSEIACLIQDTNVMNVRLNGSYQGNQFAHNFRMDIFREHFGT